MKKSDKPLYHDTTKSNQILARFRQRAFKAKRKRATFSAVWQTTVEELFPLLCPVREADWIPGWDCELIYSESGFAEENCVFSTNATNPSGGGFWIFTGYKVNDHIEFVRMQEDMLTRTRITVKDNQDGSVSGMWDVLYTGLTENGNRTIEGITSESGDKPSPLYEMLEHYLQTGKSINRTQLAGAISGRHAKAHFPED